MTNSIYEFGPFKLNASERLLYRSKKRIKLTPKAFEVLLVLVQRPNRIFSTQDLLDAVWPDTTVEPVNLNKNIYLLRRTLGGRRDQYIETVPRVGYRFACSVNLPAPIDNVGSIVTAELPATTMTMGPLFELFTSYTMAEESKAIAATYDLMAAAHRNAAAVFETLAAKRRQEAADIGQSLCSQQNVRFKMRIDLHAEDRANIYFERARQASQKLLGAEQTAWLDRLELERDELIAALDYYKNQDSGATHELEMAIFLSRFWNMRSAWSEGREALRHALDRQEPGDSALKAKGLGWLGWLSCRQGDYEDARQSLSESITMGRNVGDKEGLACSLKWMGLVEQTQGDYQQAKKLFKESLKLSEEIKSDRLIAEALHCLGFTAEAEGDYETANGFYSRYLSKSEEIQDVREIAAALNCLGVVAREQGDYAKAQEYHHKSLALRQGTGNTSGISFCYFHLGLLEEALGRHETAGNYFQKSLALRVQIGNKLGIVQALERIAKTADAMGEVEGAALIYGAADAIRESLAVPLSPAEDKSYGQSRSSVKNKFLRKWQEGRRWPADQAVAYASSLGITSQEREDRA